MSDTRLAWRIGQQSSVEKRNQRLHDRLFLAVREMTDDTPQHLSWFQGTFAFETVCRREVSNEVNQATRQVDADRGSVMLFDSGNGAFDGAGQVERNAIRGFGWPEATAFGREIGAELHQLSFEGLGYEDFVETSSRCSHKLF